jgi:hypothetical protein
VTHPVSSGSRKCDVRFFALTDYLPVGSLSLSAILTNSGRDSACILRMTYPRLIFGVTSLVPSLEATCLISISETPPRRIFIAWTNIGMSPCPVMRMIGMRVSLLCL